jgi:hypothetical protein
MHDSVTTFDWAIIFVYLAGVVGYVKVGGWSALAQTLATPPHPMAGAAGFPATTGNFLNMARSASDPSGQPWYSILLGFTRAGLSTCGSAKCKFLSVQVLSGVPTVSWTAR